MTQIIGTWTIHFLNARGRLSGLERQIESAITETFDRVAGVCNPLTMDIVVQGVVGGGISEVGHVGYAPSPGLVYLTFDPENPNLPGHMGASLRQTIAHEMHHAMRWEQMGYGTTLLQSIVSEGLAGRFVEELFSNEPELWERALAQPELGQIASAAQDQLHDISYSHGDWFFGAGDLPRWAGYTIGWELVGAYLDDNTGARPSNLANEPAEAFLPYFENLIAPQQ